MDLPTRFALLGLAWSLLKHLPQSGSKQTFDSACVAFVDNWRRKARPRFKNSADLGHETNRLTEKLLAGVI